MRVRSEPPLDERALREAHATLTRILGAIEEYVYTGELLGDDRAYRLVFAGPCREQFLGLSAAEARTAVWRHYVHPDDMDLFDDAHDGAVADGRLDVEYRLVGADGVVRWVRDRGRVREEDGRTFLDGSILDVTEVHLVQEQLRAARAEADRLAHVDELTGAGNRRSLGRVLRREACADRPLGLLSVDLDHFKQVNDHFGHAAGDAVLVAIADRLRACVRAGDVVLRMGGEEFLVVLRGVEDDRALVAVGEAVRRRVEAEPVEVGPHPLSVTVSIGAAFVPAGAPDPSELLIEADHALYEAKSAGRNRVALAMVGAEPGDRPAAHESAAFRVAHGMAVAAGALEDLGAEHLTAVSDLAAAVAHRLGRPAAEVQRCRLAGLVHDVGKLRVPAAVLAKAGPLDEDEWAAMRLHAEHGEELLRQVPELRPLARIVRHHHERVDGRGYPDRLAGDGIPFESRVVAVVDTWSAMRSDRAYRPALPAAAALEELARAAGSQLDAEVVAALQAVLGAGPVSVPLAA